MKKAIYVLSILFLGTSFATNAQELEPDQNPNYKKSAEKYADRMDELTANQGQTVQDTYKAYDWREAKEEARQLRLERRHELKKMRYQSHNRCYMNGYSRYNGGFYNYNNGYYNGGFNNGFYNNNTILGAPTLGGVLLGTGLGYGLYTIFN